MTVTRAVQLMKIERECIKRAETCNRDCRNCGLVQPTADLLEAYDVVIAELGGDNNSTFGCAED